MTVDLQEAAKELDMLAEKAIKGEEVTLTRDGHPVVKLTPVSPAAKRRLGGLEHLGYTIPDDFDTMFQKEIEEMFYGSSDPE